MHEQQSAGSDRHHSPAPSGDPHEWAQRVRRETEELFEFRAGRRAGIADVLLKQDSEGESSDPWRRGYEAGREEGLGLAG